MKCTLPEPDRDGYNNEKYYNAVISELWENGGSNSQLENIG